MARAKKLTASVLEGIPTFVEQGLSAPEIARKIGCTVGTLRVTCSRSKISLRRKDSAPKTRRVSSPDHATMTIQLPKITVGLLRQQAIVKGIEATVLVAMLLEMIVQDGLFDAVLG
jgi:hypothetical protein